MPKILLVEDNEMNRDMLTRRLQRRGYEVVVAVDGFDGLAVARDQTPDLILMDRSLPIVDGWEATRQLKADPSTRSIPVIALTAHAMDGDKDRAVEAGFDGYVTKPFRIGTLLTAIQECLDGIIAAGQGAQL